MHAKYSGAVIKAMQHGSSRFRVPQEVFTNNGPYFMSAEYQQLATKWDFKITASFSHYSQVNGLAKETENPEKRSMEMWGPIAWTPNPPQYTRRLWIVICRNVDGEKAKK